MKQFLVLVLTLFIYLPINSQNDWIDLPLTEGIWSSYSYAVGDGAQSLPVITRHYSTEGDTLINGETYLKLVVNSDPVPLISPDGQNDVPVGAIRQENKQIFIIWEGETAVDTLYDFNIEIGTVIERYEDNPWNNCGNNPCPYVKLNAIDSITLADGLVRSRYVFHAHEEGNSGEVDLGEISYWIEGVGGTTGFFGRNGHILDIYNSTVTPHGWRELLCLEVENSLIYTGSQFDGNCNIYTVSIEENELEDHIKIYPNPVQNDLNITLELSKGLLDNLEYNIIGLDGRVIIPNTRLDHHQTFIDLTDIPNGFYILKITNGVSSLSQRIIKMK